MAKTTNIGPARHYHDYAEGRVGDDYLRENFSEPKPSFNGKPKTGVWRAKGNEKPPKVRAEERFAREQAQREKFREQLKKLKANRI